MATLDKAILIAAKVHYGQKDRCGVSYILHPIRVMMRVHSEAEKIAAILHDVIEDSDWTLDDLRNAGFTEAIIQAVNCLTKRDKEPYMDYIERTKQNPTALKVKLADLEDNMNLTRMNDVSKKDTERLLHYHKAWTALMNAEKPEIG